MDYSDFYANIKDVKKEIIRRNKDVNLLNKIEEYLNGDIPKPFKSCQRAVMFRNIISPDLEFLNFINMSKETGLNVLGLEYLDDKFCTRNQDKLCLVKLAFFEKRDKNQMAIINYKKIVDIKLSDNKKFSDIKTLGGENLIDFHHNLLKKNISEEIELYDMSEWIKRNGSKAIEYYKKLLALFICNGVLFENFLLEGEEDLFTKEVFLPAFILVSEFFGLKPLILPAIKPELINDKYWWCYSKLIE
jgi:hypothetical protein